MGLRNILRLLIGQVSKFRQWLDRAPQAVAALFVRGENNIEEKKYLGIRALIYLQCPDCFATAAQ